MSASRANAKNYNNEQSWFTYLYGKYLPFCVVEHVKRNELVAIHPERERFEAAVAFVDISGFTKLSERLIVEHGEDGAELLNKYISEYFERLIDMILDYGGDILKFAGDAMLVVWRNKVSKANNKLERLRVRNDGQKAKLKNMFGDSTESLSVLVMKATACCFNIMQKLNNFEPAKGIKLTLHTGIAAGILSGLFVGGVEDLWEYFVAGKPIGDMSDACDLAGSGEVVIANETYELIQTWAESKAIDANYVKVVSVADKPRVIRSKMEKIDSYEEKFLHCFLPAIIQQRDLSDESNLFYPEYRRAYIMFIKICGMNYESSDVLDLLQTTVCAIQEIILKYQGAVVRLLADDKGTRFKIVFGLPGMVHEDDSVRVVLAALEIHKRLKNMNVQCYTGIANGTVFCGDAGCHLRSEYTAVGYKVNVAARMMQAAEKLDKEILCDDNTFQKSRHRDIAFEVVAPIKMKGVAEPVPIFRPVMKSQERNFVKSAKLLGMYMDSQNVLTEVNPENSFPDAPSRSRSNDGTPRHRPLHSASGLDFSVMVGRSHERRTLTQFLSGRLEQDLKYRPVIWLSGSMGIGKSTLANYAKRKAERNNMRVLVGQGISLNVSNSYSPWKYILNDFFDFNDMTSTDEKEKEIMKHLTAEYSPLSAVLNDVLETKFEETSFTRQMTTSGRALTVRKLIVAIFRSVALGTKTKYLIVLEDIHWFDSASLAQAHDLFQSEDTNVYGIITTRHLIEEKSTEYSLLEKMPINYKMELQTLDSRFNIELACQRLGVSNLPPSLSAAFQKTNGNPMYTEELAKTLIESRIVTRSEDGTCTVNEDVEDGKLKLPQSVRDIIIARLDCLEKGPQLTLKLCSALGHEVRANLLLACDPAKRELPKLRSDVQVLINAGFLVEASSTKRLDDRIALFKNDLIKEVAYATLLMEQRKSMHRAAFEYLESERKKKPSINPSLLRMPKKVSGNYRDKRMSVTKTFLKVKNKDDLGYLAHHATKAELWSKALEYLDRAAMQSLQNNSNMETVSMVRTALEIAHDNPEIPTAKQLENFNLLAGIAYYNSGFNGKAIDRLRDALALNGNSIPTGAREAAFAMYAGRAKHFFKKKIQRVSVDNSKGKSTPKFVERDEQQIRAIEMLDYLVQACLNTGDVNLAGYCAFMMKYVSMESDYPAYIAAATSYCAYISLVVRKPTMSLSYVEKCELVLKKNPSIPELHRARTKMFIAMTKAARGEWKEALSEFQIAKKSFSSLGERKKWRETTLMIGVTLYMSSRFEECSHHFSKLLRYAYDDDDLDLLAKSFIWKAHVHLTTKGSSEEVHEYLTKSLTILKDLRGKHESVNKKAGPDETLVVRAAIAYNQFCMYGNLEDGVSADSLTESLTKELLIAPKILWWDIHKYTYTLRLTILLMQRQATKKLAQRAQHTRRMLKYFTKEFIYGKPIYKILLAQGFKNSGHDDKAMDKITKAIDLANELAMPYISALGWYEKAKWYALQNKDEMKVCLSHVTKALDQCGIEYRSHPRFVLLHSTEPENNEKTSLKVMAEGDNNSSGTLNEHPKESLSKASSFTSNESVIAEKDNEDESGSEISGGSHGEFNSRKLIPALEELNYR